MERKDIIIMKAGDVHTHLIADWWNAAEDVNRLPEDKIFTAEMVKERLERETDETGRTYILYFMGGAIGSIIKKVVSEKTAEVSIVIWNEAFRDREIGQGALYIFIEDLFSQGFESVRVIIPEENSRARHVFEKLGFRMLEGTETRENGDIMVSYEIEKGMVHHFSFS